MKKGMKILVGVDGSQHSDKAFDTALDLAEKYSASILVISVIPSIMHFGIGREGSEPPMWPSKVIEGQRGYHEKVLAEALQKAKKIKPDLDVSTKLAEGQPANKIIETAKEGNFDLIILGSRGLGSVASFFLGSVSHGVVNRAESEVLIIK